MSTPEEKGDPWDRFLGWLDRAATWPQRGSLGRRLLLLVLSVAVIVGLVLFVSNNWWRDEIPRSGIAAVALGLGVLIALWLFGTRGSNVALSILAAIGAILIAAGTALDLDEVLSDGPPPKGALVDCPDFPGGFDGTVAPTEIGYAHLRAEPNLHSDVLLRYPPDAGWRSTATAWASPRMTGVSTYLTRSGCASEAATATSRPPT